MTILSTLKGKNNYGWTITVDCETFQVIRLKLFSVSYLTARYVLSLPMDKIHFL